MQKIGIIYLFIFLISACSVSNISQTGLTNRGLTDANSAIKSTIENNITNDGFFINKGKISTSGETGRISLYFTMKYKLPATYLISLRSKTGLEAYRIFISGDTVLINDRLNKTLLTGSPFDFERITGIPSELLKISIGDFFYNEPKYEKQENCTNGELKLSDYFLGMIVKTTLDCAVGKPKSLLLTTGITDEYINVEYRKYRDDKKKLPKIVEVYDFRRKIKIKISVFKYSSPWYGDIQFIPGSGYNIKPLI